MDSHRQLVFGLKSNLPGEAQTVPRAELFALVILLQQVEPGSELVYYTDHKNLAKYYPLGKQYCIKSLNLSLIHI